MNVLDLMTPAPMTCRPADSLHDAAQRLWSEDCGSLPVVDGRNRLVGMITDRDIAMAGYLRNRRLGEIRVADTMSRQITSCKESDALVQALDAMRETRVRRLPVCDDEGTLRGILSIGDALRATQGDRKLAESALATLTSISTPRGERVSVLEPQAPGTASPTTSAGAGDKTGKKTNPAVAAAVEAVSNKASQATQKPKNTKKPKGKKKR